VLEILVDLLEMFQVGYDRSGEFTGKCQSIRRGRSISFKLSAFVELIELIIIQSERLEHIVPEIRLD
jgi:hypothetical protein